MSTRDVRERIRLLRLKCIEQSRLLEEAQEHANKGCQSTGDLYSSIVTASTSTQMANTAPTQLPSVNEKGHETPPVASVSVTNPSLPNKNWRPVPHINSRVAKHIGLPRKGGRAHHQVEKRRSISVDNNQKEKSAHNQPNDSDCKMSSSVTSISVERPPFNGSSIVINGRLYSIIDLIGKGGSSKVYQMVDDMIKKCRAVKIVDLTDADKSTREAYMNEIYLLLDLKNSGCVVELFDYELRGDYLYIVMEKGDIDLATFLKTKREHIDDIFIRFYWQQMLNCVSVIHKKGIVHSDLKPANFLIVGGSLKLIDFGIASAIPHNKTSIFKDNQMGTLSYMPPEAIGASGDMDEAVSYRIKKNSDVWSLGCILYNMVYGGTPYQNWTNSFQKMRAIVNYPVEFPMIENTVLLDVLKRCLVKDPDKRATVAELQNHPYLKNDINNCDGSVADENAIMKIIEDIKHGTPRTSARKLRSLISQQKNNVIQLKTLNG